jgi:hypothetical protein
MVAFKWDKSFALPFFLIMILLFTAFADYSGGLAGIECEDSNVREGIEAIHAQGGKVKVSMLQKLFSTALAQIS